MFVRLINSHLQGARIFIACFISILIFAAPLSAQNAAPEQTTAQKQNSLPDYMAIIDGEEILWLDYIDAFNTAARKTFYHGEVSQQRQLDLQISISNDMIEKQLVVNEAVRRNIAIDETIIDQRLEDFDKENSTSESWASHREAVLESLRKKMLNNILEQALETEIRKVDEPKEEELRSFYTENIDMFTEPTQERVGVILLGVEPSALSSVWAAANEEAKRIRGWLLDGAEFAKLAKLHSTEESSENSGDMGYLHRGMLSESAQTAVDKLSIGEISEVVQLLQGPALFKLYDRRPSVVIPYEDAREKSADLYVRNKTETQWEEFISSQLISASIEYHPKILEMQQNLKALNAEEAKKQQEREATAEPAQ